MWESDIQAFEIHLAKKDLISKAQEAPKARAVSGAADPPEEGRCGCGGLPRRWCRGGL